MAHQTKADSHCTCHRQNTLYLRLPVSTDRLKCDARLTFNTVTVSIVVPYASVSNGTSLETYPV